MDETLLDNYKKALLALEQDLKTTAQTAEEMSQTVELDQSKVGRLSRMDALQAQALAKDSVKRRTSMLRGIKAALGRIELGSFGYCLQCDERIPAARLSYDPTVIMCVQCAEKTQAP